MSASGRGRDPSGQSGVGLVEFLVALVLFAVCMVTLSQMQLRAAMASTDNHQRAVALWSARGLVDRMSANDDREGLLEYVSLLEADDHCAAAPAKRCETTVSQPLADACDARELAAHDVWSVFCDGDGSLGSQVLGYEADLSCAGPCDTNVDMALRVSWISRVLDSDARTSAPARDADGVELPGGADSLVLRFRP